MAEPFPRFIGREKELCLVQNLLNSDGTCVLLVSGPGGVGKSLLLQEVRERIERGLLAVKGGVLCTEVINLDDISIHIPLTLKHSIGMQLSPPTFKEFNQIRNDYLEAQLRGMPAQVTSRLLKQADQLFLESYNRLVTTHRALLLLDAVETVLTRGLWGHMARDVFPKLANSVIVLAGRNIDRTLYPDLRDLLSTANVICAQLPSFTTEESEAYLTAPEIRLNIDPELRLKLSILSQGRPILIALAVEWLRREMALPQCIRWPLKQVQLLQSKLASEFEEELVRTILNLERPQDWAVMVMSYAHRRMDVEMLAHLMDAPVDGVLRESLLSLPFIKQRPGQQFVLHDEMQQLVSKHNWPLLDPTGSERQNLGNRLVAYYDEAIKELSDQLSEARRTIESARKRGAKTEGLVDTYTFLREHEPVRWALGAERLYYSLHMNLEEGYKYFIHEFDWAAEHYYFAYCELLRDEMEAFEQQFSETRRFNVAIRVARLLLDRGSATDAQAKGTEILERFARTGEERVEALVHLGNCALRLGHPIEARNLYSQARDICDEQGLQSYRATVENGLGLAYRSSGDWDRAAKHYRESVSACERFNSPSQHLASALNNYAYFLGLRGRYEEAIALCEQALSLRKDIKHWRSVGQSYSTLGELYRYQQRYERAFECYEQARRIFEEQNDREWLAVIYQEWAIAKAYAGELDEAWINIQRALELCERYNIRALPWALNRAGRIARFRAEYDQSENFLRRGIAEAEKAGDVWFLLATTVELMESRYARFQKKRDVDIQELWTEFEKLAGRVEEYEHAQYGFHELFGRMWRIVGHVQYDLGNYDGALEYYKKAYPLIASGYYGSHGLHKLPEELEELGKRIDALAPMEAIRWCDELRKAWGKARECVGLTGFCATHKHKAQQRMKAKAA